MDESTRIGGGHVEAIRRVTCMRRHLRNWQNSKLSGQGQGQTTHIRLFKLAVSLAPWPRTSVP